jgi:hypothetical protein
MSAGARLEFLKGLKDAVLKFANCSETEIAPSQEAFSFEKFPGVNSSGVFSFWGVFQGGGLRHPFYTRSR